MTDGSFQLLSRFGKMLRNLIPKLVSIAGNRVKIGVALLQNLVVTPHRLILSSCFVSHEHTLGVGNGTAVKQEEDDNPYTKA
jgi:hypothetical protein